MATIAIFDSSQFSGNRASDCGDGPFACPTGLTFSRFTSAPAVAGDATGVHVVWNGELPSGQPKVFVRNSPDGISWPTPASTLDTVALRHQWTPDIASDGGVINVVFYDSRADPTFSPSLPLGDTASGANSGDVMQTYLATSTDGGVSWGESQISTHGSNFNWETHGSRRDPFWGDYIYVSAAGGSVMAAWTDSRDLVPGRILARRAPTTTGTASTSSSRASTCRTTSMPLPTARRWSCRRGEDVLGQGART
jgi:hypothetical protein